MNPCILLVDDDPSMIQVMGRLLSGLGAVRFATTGQAALEQMRDATPDLVLLDAEMPCMSGYQVCEAMQRDPGLRDVPVIFVTAHSGLEYELKGLGVGAVDFIGKPISEPLLVARVRTQLRVKQLTDELKRIATIDALTEVANRRSFDDALGREWKRSQRSGEPLSLLLIDVDHFKRYNDHYGHPAGDACLRLVADALRRSLLRPGDSAARYGGEEFALLLPQTARAGAQQVAERVLSAVNACCIPHEQSTTAPHVTVSIGVGSYDDDCDSWVRPVDRPRLTEPLRVSARDLVECADRALYRAKHAGRARAVCVGVEAAEDVAALVPSTFASGADRDIFLGAGGSCRMVAVR